jgi:hypothetical protein
MTCCRFRLAGHLMTTRPWDLFFMIETTASIMAFGAISTPSTVCTNAVAGSNGQSSITPRPGQRARHPRRRSDDSLPDGASGAVLDGGVGHGVRT